MPEEEVVSPEETTQEPGEAPQEGESPAPQESQEAGQEGAGQEAESQEDAEQKEKEEKRKKRQKKLHKLLIRFLLLLLLLLLLFEAAMGFLWWRYGVLEAEQEEAQAAQTITQRRVTNSAYANWGGVYWPVDWPSPVDAFASIPDYLRLQPEGEAPSQQPEDPGTAP